MFGKKKVRKIKLTENQLRQHVISAMYFLSDGLEWHTESAPEKKNPLVMGSPEEIAETVVKYVFWLPSGEDPSSTATP